MIMEDFIAFFSELSTLQKFVWVVICMAFFWLVEGAYPMLKGKYKKWKHAKVNLVLLGTTMLINAGFGAATAGVFVWMDTAEFGINNWLEMPLWASFIFSILLLDFVAQFGVHFILHKVPFMWRLHMVHHSDTMVDVTSGTRHHPADYLLREVFSLLAIIIGGIPFAFYGFYRILTVLFTYWTHANLRLPSKLDKALSYIIVTPNMHKFHHHFERPWTDTNFGNILSIWDRIFGTYVYGDINKVEYGLDVLDNSQSQNLRYQLKVPFDKAIKMDTIKNR
jgi:sterol desaturase/sphingolipid hydroxylase (fatty acid hydroxylase superfamily)